MSSVEVGEMWNCLAEHQMWITLDRLIKLIGVNESIDLIPLDVVMFINQNAFEEDASGFATQDEPPQFRTKSQTLEEFFGPYRCTFTRHGEIEVVPSLRFGSEGIKTYPTPCLRGHMVMRYRGDDPEQMIVHENFTLWSRGDENGEITTGSGDMSTRYAVYSELLGLSSQFPLIHQEFTPSEDDLDPKIQNFQTSSDHQEKEISLPSAWATIPSSP